MSERKVLIGNALDVLKELPNESIDVCVTSPPYWALRDYGSEPVIWGGDHMCQHEWGEHIESARGGVGTNANVGANRDGAANNRGHPTITHYCAKCGAWRGQLGLEPTFQEYIDHLLMIFDEVHRVLKPTGACFVNIADTYGGSKKGNTETNKNNKVVTDSFVKKAPKDVPHKSLCLIPQRFAIGMVERGWVCRNQINWCLDELTPVICKVDGVLYNLPIREVYARREHRIEVPTQDARGNLIWASVKRVYDRGEQDGFKITLTNGRSVVCSGNHEFPSKVMCTKPSEYLKVNIRKASELNMKSYLHVRFDGFVPIDRNINQKDYNEGWAAGFYLAEGSYLRPQKRELKNTKYSLYAQKRWGGHVIPEHIGIQLACGLKDIERGYVDNIKRMYPSTRVYIYGSSVAVHVTDRAYIELIEACIEGHDAHTNHPTDYAFNRGPDFCKGLIDGFLAGDGHYDAPNDRWRVRICRNFNIRDWMDVACALVGYEMRIEGEHHVSSCKNGKMHETLGFTIRKNPRHVSMGVKACKVESIEHVGMRHMYDIEVETLFDVKRDGKANIRANNLYFLGNGIWTHNCKPNVMPQSCTDRFTVDSEPMFFFTKESSGYYFNQLKEPVAESSKKRAEYGWKSDKANLGPGGGGVEVERMGERFVPEDGRNMRTTWCINTSASTIEHCAMFPKALIERPIQACCPPGGVVLDPFCGSGTTLEYCFEHDIDAIGIEINPDFKGIIERRMHKGQRGLGEYEEH